MSEVSKKFDKASDALTAARNLIRDTRQWVVGYLAVRTVKVPTYYGTETDTERRACSTKAKNAEAFCALGAVKRINGPAERQATAFLREAGLQILKEMYLKKYKDAIVAKNSHIFKVNDEKGHKNVMKMFSRAIRRAKELGK